MAFENGNKADSKHYWLTPPDLMKQLQDEFDFDFDPCPYPKPDDFDGLTAEWGQRNYVNPPFGGYIDQHGKKKGITAWARKCIEEYKKGKLVVLVCPMVKWTIMLLTELCMEVRNLKDVRWHAIEDNSPGPGIGYHIAMFILDPTKKQI